MDSLKLHERHRPMTRAERAIQEAIGRAVEEHGLTYAELWMILATIQMQWAKPANRGRTRQ